MASRIHKKNRAVEEHTDDHRKEHHQSELFPLEYLNHSITYLLAKPQDQSYLRLDPTALELVISEDPSRLGLHFVERMKLMKESCEPEQFMKDYQECGDFINYDLSREHQSRLLSIEAQLKQENEKQIEIKRVFRSVQRVSLSELQRRQSVIRQGILTNLLKDYEMVVEDKQSRPPSNSPINEMPGLTCSRQELPCISAPLQEAPSESVTQKGKVETEKTKKGPKPEKARKIKKQPKKGQGKVDFQEEYVPNMGKRGGRSEEYLPSPFQKRQYNMDSAGPESSQYVMPRRSNQYFQDKQSKYEDSSFKDESHEARSQKVVPLSSHSKRKSTKNSKEGKTSQPRGRPKLNSAGNKKSQKSQIFEDQVSVLRQADLQSREAGQMMEVEDIAQRALGQADRPDEGEAEGGRRHVSIGIQTSIDHSEDMLFQEEEVPSEVVQDHRDVNNEERRNQEEDISSLLKLD